jgi:aminoglycoside phosphotransferase (APT) family kinase protein
VTSTAEHKELLEKRFPELRPVDSIEPTGGGWDSFTYVVNGVWVFHFPRLPGVEETLRRQVALLRGLNGEVSSAVPVPSFVSTDPVCIGYRRIEGAPLPEHDLSSSPGIWPERLGRFLYDLHLVLPEFVGLRAAGPAAWREEHRALIDDLRGRVLPLIDVDDRAIAGAMLSSFVDDDLNFRFATAVVHRDLGPEHILRSADGDLAGVIDWGDATIGDPAIDFAWVLHHAPAGERVLAAYGGVPDERFRERARFYDRLGPWHEVVYGLDTGQGAFVESGLDGVARRLP